MNTYQAWVERIYGAMFAFFVIAVPLIAWAIVDGHVVFTRPASRSSGPTIFRLF